MERDSLFSENVPLLEMDCKWTSGIVVLLTRAVQCDNTDHMGLLGGKNNIGPPANGITPLFGDTTGRR